MKNKFSNIEETINNAPATPKDIPDNVEELEELKKKVTHLENRLTYFFSRRRRD